MADICVFGSPAWDIVYRIGVLPAAGGDADVEALGGRPGGVQPTWRAVSGAPVTQ